jgi:hypothetical protein
VPRAEQASITYHFDRSVTVSEMQLQVAADGVTAIEGFVGDSLKKLVSIGVVQSKNAARDKPYHADHQEEMFQFDPTQTRPGHIFRFVVRETVQPNRYTNFAAIPRDAKHGPFDVGVEVAFPGSPRLTGLDAFCQALLNLNEFVYVQ